MPVRPAARLRPSAAPRRRGRGRGPTLAAVALALALAVGAGAAPRAENPSQGEAEIRRLQAALAERPGDAALRRQLGDALFRDGRAFESLEVLNPGRAPDASFVKELRQAAELYRRSGRTDAARAALERALEIAPGDKSLYEALAAVYDAAERAPAGEAQAAPSDALGDARARAAANERLAPRRVGGLAAAAAGAVLAALALLRVLRGRGDLAVSIELPSDRRGAFSVRVARKRPRRRATVGDEAAALAERASSRLEHNMVSRDTQFHGLKTGSWWVVVEGVVESGGAPRVRTAVFEEREIRVERGRALRIDFDLRPRECPVELRIVQGGGPAPRARLALAGDLHSLRYAPQGSARLSLPAGVHRVVVGGTDRVAEREIRIDELAPKTVVIDLADGGVDLVFAGCEAAVEPYLQGDLSIAAAALERGQQPRLAHLLRARFHRARGELERAAAAYEAAERPLEAAEAWSEAASFERAAALFQQGGDPGRAAELYEAAGDLLRAGRAFENADDLESAARCYREAQAVPKLIEVLEKRGECYEAAQLAFERGEVSRAIRNFQQVEARHERYPEVCRFLAERFSEQGKLELAVQKADEAITWSGASAASADTLAWYGDLLERAGRTQRALEAYRELRTRAPERAGVGDRIEALEQRLSAERGAARAGGSERYEILGELGRGGMGVVYKARDKRLGRVVALKRLPDPVKDNPRAVELFLREARSAAALNHPNIVTVHDVDQDETGFFLTMELLEGQTLS
ncbi:MAG TPA: tetratricopeptide repeat protein, partial [Myxococcota bacterium]|nr:tetratricopeptide repeat protein [Myxococcota bacterium]